MADPEKWQIRGNEGNTSVLRGIDSLDRAYRIPTLFVLIRTYLLMVLMGLA